MNLLIRNDVELTAALRRLENVQQVVALAVELGRRPREVIRAAQQHRVICHMTTQTRNSSGEVARD